MSSFRLRIPTLRSHVGEVPFSASVVNTSAQATRGSDTRSGDLGTQAACTLRRRQRPCERGDPKLSRSLTPAQPSMLLWPVDVTLAVSEAPHWRKYTFPFIFSNSLYRMSF